MLLLLLLPGQSTPSKLPGAEIESCWEDEPMDPISMEPATSPSNPDPGSSRPPSRPPQRTARCGICARRVSTTWLGAPTNDPAAGRTTPARRRGHVARCSPDGTRRRGRGGTSPFYRTL
uniref:Uncharacterized protein n=1 Tax=Arundo donax TaxID=35708 RepID=A0A0A9CKX2_ARUDO